MALKPGDYAVVRSSLSFGMRINYTHTDIAIGEVVQILQNYNENVELVGKRPILWMAARFQKVPRPPPFSLLEKVIWGIK